MKGALGDMMKKAQEMQENLQKAQRELANKEVTGEAGGGMVSVVMRGTHEVNRVTIDPSLVDEDVEYPHGRLQRASPFLSLSSPSMDTFK